jgi:hypothetical protein
MSVAQHEVPTPVSGVSEDHHVLRFSNGATVYQHRVAAHNWTLIGVAADGSVIGVRLRVREDGSRERVSREVAGV